MESRHNELEAEMLRRGMNAKSPYIQPDLSKYDLEGFIVDKEAALVDLVGRCQECQKRANSY